MGRFQSFREADNGRTVTLSAPTEKITLYLEGNPSTGFTWYFNDATDVLESKDKKGTEVFSNEHFNVSRTYQAGDEAELVGAGGMYKFVVAPKRKLKKGQVHTLNFSYGRSWENAVPDKKFSISVVYSD